MVNSIEGDLNAEGLKFGVAASRFNDFITDRLVEGALAALTRHGAVVKDIEVIKVPGAFEIPMAARKMAAAKKYDAILCLGAVIRGATPHFDYVAGEAARGVGSVALESSIPVLFGVLTTDNLEQAIERSGSQSGNKGWETALAAIAMANLYKKI